MEFSKHPVLWLLLILGCGGGGGGRSSLCTAGAGTWNKLCVLHTQVALTVLLRGKELWMPCLSPSKGFGDEACALESVFQQRSSAGATCWGEAPSSLCCQADGLPCSQSSAVFKVMPR